MAHVHATDLLYRKVNGELECSLYCTNCGGGGTDLQGECTPQKWTDIKEELQARADAYQLGKRPSMEKEATYEQL